MPDAEREREKLEEMLKDQKKAKFNLNLDLQMFAINDEYEIKKKIKKGLLDSDLFYRRKQEFDKTFETGIRTPIETVHNRFDSYFHIINRHEMDWFHKDGVHHIKTTLVNPNEIFETSDKLGNKAHSYFSQLNGEILMVIVRNDIITAYKPDKKYVRKVKRKGKKIYGN